MDLLGPLAAACPQMYYQGQPVAPPASAPAHKVHDLVASEEPIFQPWPQACCLSAAELAAILGVSTCTLLRPCNSSRLRRCLLEHSSGCATR
jgi:hypothetical protein